MHTKVISHAEALRFGWGITKNNLALFTALMLATAFAAAVGTALGNEHLVLLLAVQAIHLALTMAWIHASLRLHDGQTVRLTDLIVSPAAFLNFLLASVLYGLIVGFGLLLLIVPGVLWAIKFGLYGFVVMDEDVDPVAALQRSASLTEDVKADLLVFGAILIAVNLVGLLALGIGLYATVPTTVVAAAFVYRKLQARLQARQTIQTKLEPSPA